MLGREVNTPAHLMFPQSAGKYVERTEDYVADLRQNMQNAHETARKTMKTTSRAMKRNYDLRLLERSYKLGDAVYLLDTATLKGLCKKLGSLCGMRFLLSTMTT